MRRSFLKFGDFRVNPKLAEEFTISVGKSTTKFDHIAIDMGPITGASGRFIKGLQGVDRDEETTRFVYKTIFHNILRRYHPVKSVAIFFDGSDPLWKVRRSRRFPGKKGSSRFFRSCCSPVSFQMEEKIRHALADSARGANLQEFLISGPSTPGPVESKVSAWLRDLGHRSRLPQESPSSPQALPNSPSALAAAANAANSFSVTPGDSIALIGGEELFLSALGASSFTAITNIILDQRDFKSMTLEEGLEWLTFDSFMKNFREAGGDAAPAERLASIRTDAIFLYILSNGCAATDLGGCGIPFNDMMASYLSLSTSPITPAAIQSNKTKEGNVLAAEPEEASNFLISRNSSSSNPSLSVNLPLLVKLLAKACRKSPNAKEDRISHDFLEISIQSLCMYADGGIRNLGYIPKAPLVETPSFRPEAFVGHIKFIIQQQQQTGHNASIYYSPTIDESFALTPAEQLLLSSETDYEPIEQIMPSFTNGHRIPTEVVDTVFNATDFSTAVNQAKDILSHAIPSTQAEGEPPGTYILTSDKAVPSVEGAIPHEALRHMPTYYFARKRAFPGPPAGFEFYPINLGLLSRSDTSAHWATSYRATGVALSAGERGGKDIISIFDTATKMWKEVSITEANSTSPSPMAPTNLKVICWNVQFNRFSGEKTPLGRPGIDWCTRTRYFALSKILQDCDADIICMQEVEPAWWEHLSKEPFFQETYAFSTGVKGPAIKPYGQLILVNKKRVPLVSLENLNIPGYTGHSSVMPSVVVRVRDDKTSVAINNLHLVSPHNKNSADVRISQFEELQRVLKKQRKAVGVLPGSLGKPTLSGMLVMGDFNDHPGRDSLDFAPELGLVDAWSRVRNLRDDNEEGFTINGNKNLFCGKIIEPEFFGRADRVYCSASDKVLKPMKVSLIGTSPVCELGIEVIKRDNMPCPDYLFPSDHFGLMVEYSSGH